MAGRILVINHGAAFTVDSLKNNLTNAGFLVHITEPDRDLIRSYKESIDIILMYAGDYILNAADVMEYIRELCADEDKKFFVVGYPAEIEEIKKVISEHLIERQFERPFDMKYLIQTLREYSQDMEEHKKSRHILVCDDDVMFLKMIKEWLSHKYQVTIVKSGMQALTYIANHRPDLILLDYDMPVTSGPMVMEMIRSESESADIPVIFLTGKSDKESVMTVMKLKPQGYILKTMPKKEIVATIDHYFVTQLWNQVVANGEALQEFRD